MKINLTFHDSLLKYTNVKHHTIVCNDFISLVSALSSLFPDFGNYIRRIQSMDVLENLCLLDKNKKLITNKVYKFNRFREEHTDLYIIPMIAGAGGKKSSFLQIGIGIALVALPMMMPAGAGSFMATKIFSTTIGSMMTSMGVNMILGGLMSLFTKTPKPPEKQISDAQERIDNNMFSGLTNTTSSNNNVPITYGMTRLAGQLISGYVKTINHGKGDAITVSGEF